MSASALIAAVHRRRPLWDPADVKHHNRTLVQDLWKQIGQELSINWLTAKSKWRGLRDYYRQLLKRELEGGEGTLGSNWRHYGEMSFLEQTMTNPYWKIKVEEEDSEGETLEAKLSPWQYPLTEGEVEEESYHVGAGGGSSGGVQEEREDDDDLHFLKSLLPDLRSLSRVRNLRLRLQIQGLVLREVYLEGAAEQGQGEGGPSLPGPAKGPQEE